MRIACLLLLSILSLNLRANEPEAQFPIRVVNEFIFFELSVNDSEPLNFVFDTGAVANIFAKSTADRLGLKISGKRPIQGAAGVTMIESSTGNHMEVAGIPFDNVRFMVTDIAHLSDEDGMIDGVVGAEILRKYVVEVNYDEMFIRLYKRKGFQAPTGWEKQSMSFWGSGIPSVQASITLPNGEILTGPYLIDTGAAITVKFNTPFVEEHQLINKLGKHYAYSVRALKKEANDEVSLLPAYEVFGHKFERLSSRLSQGKAGVSASDQVHGILGLSILKRFNTVYDYYNSVMYLRPNHFYNSDFHFNHDGLRVIKREGAFRVEAVFKNSTAQEAGLQEGDLILSIDGKTDFTRHSFHHYFEYADEPVNLKVKRGEEEFSVTLSPRAMLW